MLALQMEQAENLEAAQWMEIAHKIEDLALLCGIDDEPTNALVAHLGPTPQIIDREALELGTWALRMVFDEWRQRPVGTSAVGEDPSVAQSRRAREVYEQSLMGRLLGRPHSHQPPQSMVEIMAERPAYETAQLREALSRSVTNLLDFQIVQHGPLLREAAELATAISDDTAAEPYLLSVGPTCLGPAEMPALQAYMSVIKNHPLLSAEQERTLAEKIRDGPASNEARQILIAHNLRLVARLAYFAVAPRPYLLEQASDIIQVGNLALIAAIDRFDPARGTRLSTLAVPWIRGAIRRWLYYESRLRRGNDRYRQESSQLIKNAYEQTDRLEGPRVTLRDIRRRLDLATSLRYLDDEALSQIPDPTTPRMFAEIEEGDIDRLWQVIKSIPQLSEREFTILQLYFRDGLTSRQIGLRQGNVTHQAIDLYLQRARRKVRQYFGRPEPMQRTAYNPETFLQISGAIPKAESNTKEYAAALLAGMRLPNRVRQIMALRFGLDPDVESPLTPPQIAAKLGTSIRMVYDYQSRGFAAITSRRGPRTS